MDIITQELINYDGGKYDFLRLYDVCLDYQNEECVFTFLYPETIDEITNEQRKEIEKFVKDNISLFSKIRIKFKKSFLDEKLIKREIIKFFENNYPAISAELTETQINILKKEQDKIEITLHLSKLVKDYFDSRFVKIKLLEFLANNFLGNFDVFAIEDNNFDVAEKIAPVKYKIQAKKTSRYEVTPIKKLFGKDISPFPELIKNNTKPKPSVILFGNISKIEIKSFTAKKGKMAGQEKKYATFVLNDGKQIECVYFSTKTNIPKLSALQENLAFLCLGDIREGLSGKMTYYINSMTLAQLKTAPNEDEENEILLNKRVVNVESYFENRQENIFIKDPVYNEPVASRDIVVYDLETTGLDPESCEIIEIGAIKIEKGKITKKFSTFVKPLLPIPESATKINHITDDMVENAPKIEDVIIDFYKFSKDCIISGYNNTEFDNKFLRKAYQKVNLPFENDNLDVMLLAKSKHLKTKNSKLSTVANALGIDLTGAHRAYNDAFATAKILLKLSEKA